MARGSEAVEVATWERYLLTALFGGFIVVAFAYQAVEAASSFGWVAYPAVVGAAVASFLLARVGWRVLTEQLQAQVRRRERLDDPPADGS